MSSIANRSIQVGNVASPQSRQTSADIRSRLSAALYLASTIAMTAAGLFAIAEVNRRYAPEMYGSNYMSGVAEALSNGESYGVFDLNINIRSLREEQFKRLPKAPAITVLGASQWQEAGADLIPRQGYMNAHVHRDYYEDVVGMVELMARHDRLPKDLVITIRDRIFTPVSKRTDYLWLPGIEYYQKATKRFQLEPLTFWETQPLQRARELISLQMLFANATRWHNATEWPYPTFSKNSDTLDLLHPDGSITWSRQHQALFTQTRARRLAIAHAEANKYRPPEIDPKGVEAIDRVLSYLGVRGVRVHLAHPPFNPIYFEQVRDTPYMSGLRQVAEVTRELAQKHKLGLVGSFDPADLGCTAEMYIDAEHSNAGCLQALLGDVVRSIDSKLNPLDGGSNDISDRLPQAALGEIVSVSTSPAAETSNSAEQAHALPRAEPFARQPASATSRAREPRKRAITQRQSAGRQQHTKRHSTAAPTPSSPLTWPGERPGQIR